MLLKGLGARSAGWLDLGRARGRAVARATRAGSRAGGRRLRPLALRTTRRPRDVGAAASTAAPSRGRCFYGSLAARGPDRGPCASGCAARAARPLPGEDRHALRRHRAGRLLRAAPDGALIAFAILMNRVSVSRGAAASGPMRPRSLAHAGRRLPATAGRRWAGRSAAFRGSLASSSSRPASSSTATPERTRPSSSLEPGVRRRRRRSRSSSTRDRGDLPAGGHDALAWPARA